MAGEQVTNQMGQNLALRNALLSTAPRMRKKLGTFTESSAPEGKNYSCQVV